MTLTWVTLPPQPPRPQHRPPHARRAARPLDRPLPAARRRRLAPGRVRPVCPPPHLGRVPRVKRLPRPRTALAARFDELLDAASSCPSDYGQVTLPFHDFITLSGP